LRSVKLITSSSSDDSARHRSICPAEERDVCGVSAEICGAGSGEAHGAGHIGVGVGESCIFLDACPVGVQNNRTVGGNRLGQLA
jgi:hypothetical protein